MLVFNKTTWNIFDYDIFLTFCAVKTFSSNNLHFIEAESNYLWQLHKVIKFIQFELTLSGQLIYELLMLGVIYLSKYDVFFVLKL
jgi:hypothetical protein